MRLFQNAAVLVRQFANIVVKVPKMADSISEGTLKLLAKKPGEYVKADEEIASIETDKVDVAVNAPVSGTLVKFNFKAEDTVIVGADLCEIDPSGEAPVVQKEEPPKVRFVPPEPVSAGAIARREKMSAMRRTIAERLKQSQNTTASLTTFNEIDMTELMAFRAFNKDAVLEQHDVRLGYMSAFIKACCYAQKFVPVVMARIDEQTKEIIYPVGVDISIAVATPKGLVTPVIRHCEKMAFIDVEREISRLSTKARDGKIEMTDFEGGCFTISNGGVFGSLFGTPIINIPQSAILGMHAVKERPMVVNGLVQVKPMMYICLTYDHRLIDGREAVTFLSKVKEAIESPARMLL